MIKIFDLFAGIGGFRNASEKIFKKTYKKWEEFETIREKYGALNKFQSYQSIRLGLK